MMNSESSVVRGYYRRNGPLPENRVLLSYLTGPFQLDPDSPAFYKRQDRWQTMEIARIFNELGYVVDACRYDDTNPDIRPLSEYDALFGFEPNFERFADALPDSATKIYYATGTHWSYRNSAEYRRLDRLEQRRGIQLKPQRTLPETDAEQLADAVVVVGDHYLRDDEFIADTYREHVDTTPIYHVRISAFDFLDCRIEQKEFTTARNNFLWFGGTGAVLKGLDLALEAFAEIEDKQLYVCGPVADNEAFVDVYGEELLNTDNIHLMGYVNVASATFLELTQKCAYVVNPSVSGVAIPSALITCMRSGVIPIFTTEFDANPIKWGVTLPDTDIDTIIDTIEDAANVGPAACKEMARRACERAQENYTKKTFSRDMSNALRAILCQT